jgi:SAM-dependent methyltransferase
MAANADQAAFWNAESGRAWVTRADDLDAIQAGVTDLLLAETAALPGEAVLDIGCGAGATTLAFAEAVGPAGRVLGVDISGPLLACAEARAAAAGLGQVGWLLADAQTDPLPAGFDAAISRFGVMFFDNPVAAFARIGAALRPGGRLVLAAWGPAEANPWFRETFRAAVERLGPGPPAAPDAPGPFAFADRSRVLGLLRDAGLADPTAEARRVELHLPGGLAAAVDLAGDVGPAKRLLREKGGTDADRAAIAAVLADALARYVTADGIRIPGEVNLFRARRPLAGPDDSA